ncbi:response regulator transcription factor [Sphingobacterium bambusae]|uniref:Response regulator n=1 Tax=Sphingobacterium bambusae TaxID=662858 RepID=A0ABW6BNU6_9SPHI|nr:response regulator transcription factor [Sphingobacterium bambusae]WPL48184.1 response regulator transcription factor [Sphingobacterium bambusae]
MANNISVIIVDDHPLVLRGFEFILRNCADIRLEGSFATATEALAFLGSSSVDVVLMDINLPDMNGIDATEQLKKKWPAIHVVAISNLNEASVARRMLQSGASGYLLKNVSSAELIQAIVDVQAGKEVVSKEMQHALAETKEEIPFVTAREREVLGLLAEGKTTPEIANQLFISKLTVETHRRNLLQKFKVANSASLIHRASELKFI